MVNQVTDDEDLSAVRYIENYLDSVENLPNDLQRQLSRMLDLDATCQRYIQEFDQHQMLLAGGNIDPATKRQTLLRIQKTLIIMQDIGDEKLEIMQTIQDLIEKKARQLDIDYRNIKPRLEQENHEPLNISNSNPVCLNSKNSNVNNERLTRRGRRTRQDTLVEPAQIIDTTVLSENQSSNLPSTSNGNQKRASSANANKKKKRKSVNNQSQSREETPPPEDDPDVDPDEPLYCVCNQISFGKMIMCDNDSCSLEWFHFSCVSLTTKPKGKWYCPQCRGSKPNIMKPKTQLR